MNDTEKGLIIFLVGGVGFFVLIVIFGEFFYVNPQEEPRTENTCMELMDMDFKTEQECVRFIETLAETVDQRLKDPNVREALRNLMSP